MPEFDPVGLLRALDGAGVRFVVIGGIAARLRGVPLLTEDVDITPDTQVANLEALVIALRRLNARLRTASDPDGVRFPLEPEMLRAAGHWTLVTDLGDLDIAFVPSGTSGYADLVRSADPITVAENPTLRIQVASLGDVIRSKEAAGRAKDRAALPLLRRTLEESGAVG